MSEKNDIEVTILPDGSVRVVTGKFDGAAHMSADAFVLWVQRELGGESRVQRGHHHHHGHEHDHDHDHEHE